MINSVNILDHVSVTVSDMERSLTFYCGLLGMKEVERHHLEGETISKMARKAGRDYGSGTVGSTRNAGGYA